MTSDHQVPPAVETWRDFVGTLLFGADVSKCHPCVNEVIQKNLMGINEEDSMFIKRCLSKMDISYIKDPLEIKEAYSSMINSIMFFEFLTNQ